MRKKFLAKAMCLIMALCMMIGSVAATPAYAMEVDNNAEITDTETTRSSWPIKSRIVYGQVPWAQTVNVLDGGFILHNYADVVVTAAPNSSRMVVRLFCNRYLGDTNYSDLRVTITVYRNGVAGPKIYDEIYTVNDDTLIFIGHQSDWFSVSSGETITLRIDASTANPSQSNGNYRYAQVLQCDVYCD